MKRQIKGRILCLTSSFPRWFGDSTTPFVLHLAKDLQNLGWHVDVLAPHAPGCARNEVLDGLQVKRFRYLWPAGLQSVCYQGGALINLRQKKSNYLKLPFLVVSEWSALFLRQMIRGYDLLHSHWLLPQGFVGTLAAKLSGLPQVITIHGGDVFGLHQRCLIPFKRFALKHADAVTVNSSVTENAVKSIEPTLSSVYRIPMGIDVSSISQNDTKVQAIRQKYCYGRGPLLVFVGRIVEEKGVEDFIRAVKLIEQKCPDVRAVVVGEGQDRPGLERLSKELGLTERITFTGWINSADVPKYIAAGDVFVGPSRQARNGWIEAQGLTFLEAMAVGTPVVATRNGGIIDTVIHEETGLLVDERSPKQITDSIFRIQKDKVLTKKLTVQGRSLVKKGFSRSVSASRFSEIFSSILSHNQKFSIRS